MLSSMREGLGRVLLWLGVALILIPLVAVGVVWWQAPFAPARHRMKCAGEILRGVYSEECARPITPMQYFAGTIRAWALPLLASIGLGVSLLLVAGILFPKP